MQKKKDDEKDALLDIISRRFKQARISNGYTQKELADASGVSEKTISMIENKRSLPNDRTITRLEPYLKFNRRYALGYPEDIDIRSEYINELVGLLQKNFTEPEIQDFVAIVKYIIKQKGLDEEPPEAKD